MDLGKAAERSRDHVAPLQGIAEGGQFVLAPRTVGMAKHFGMTRPLPPAFPADINKDDSAIGLRRRLGFRPAAERAEQGDLDCVFCLLPAPEEHESRPQHGIGKAFHKGGKRHLA